MRRTDTRLPTAPTVAVALILALGAIGNFDVAEELEQEAATKLIRPQIAARMADPRDAPRCPRLNAAGEHLSREIAHQADGRDWEHDCRYTTKGKP